MLNDVYSRSWIEVKLDTLADNIRALQGVVPADTQIMFVVKANAYGHGLVETAKQACACGIQWLVVAYVDEAIMLRQAIPDVNILVLGVVDPVHAKLLSELRITPVIADYDHGLEMAAQAKACACRVEAHLKIDTGMGRLGILWPEAVDAGTSLMQEDGLLITGCCSHFAMVEDSMPQAAAGQAQRFFKVADALEAFAGTKLHRHISSSRAVLCHPEWDLNGIRPGIMLYGYGAEDEELRIVTKPALQWKTHVTHVKRLPANSPVGYYGTYMTSRPTNIAVLACGYADGYLRTLSNRGHVLIRGRRYPVVGRVSMNWMAVDVGPVTDIVRGDEVVLIGEQGQECIWANELAALCRTIPYEILVEIDSSLKRLYLS